MKKYIALLTLISLGGPQLLSATGGISSGTNPILLNSDQLTAVSRVAIKRINGCGITACPNRASVSFQVQWGGSCHIYTPQFQNIPGGIRMTILDEVQNNCTRPEQANFEATIDLGEGLEIPSGTDIILNNPIYIEEVMAP